MNTLKTISEQIRRLYYGGHIPDDAELIEAEVNALVLQATARHLKLQHYENKKAGGHDIPSSSLVQYNVKLEADPDTGHYMAKLPAVPLSLPKDMGVWQVHERGNYENVFIPLISGWINRTSSLYGNRLEGRMGYALQGSKLLFAKHPKLDKIKEVTLHLIVADISKLAPYDLFPAPADMVMTIIEDVLNILKGRAPKPQANDSTEAP